MSALSSDAEGAALSSPTKPSRSRCMQRPVAVQESGSSSSEEDSWSSSVASLEADGKRGRDLSPAMEDYVRLAEARAKVKKTSREELQLRNEEQILETIASAREWRAAWMAEGRGMEAATTETLHTQVKKEIEVVRAIATLSGDLESRYVHSLKKSAAALDRIVDSLAIHALSKENARLREEKRRLESDLKMAALWRKDERREATPPPPVASPGNPPIEAEGLPSLPQSPHTSTAMASSKPPSKKKKWLHSAAVAIALRPNVEDNGVGHASTPSEAKAIVSLENLGVETLRFRQAVTGGIIVEIPGVSSGAQADALAQKLKEVLPADRVMIDCISSAEVVADLESGECSEESIKVGVIKYDTFGMYSFSTGCPVLVDKIASSRLLIDCTSARATLLVLTIDDSRERASEAFPRRSLKQLDEDFLMEASNIQSWLMPGESADADKRTEWLCSAMTDLYNASMPLPARPQAHWWSDEIAQLRKHCFSARRMYTRQRRRKCRDPSREEQLYESYKEAKKALQFAIREAKSGFVGTTN